MIIVSHHFTYIYTKVTNIAEVNQYGRLMEATDIKTAEDVKLMVDTFYAKVQQDELLANVFNDFAQVDWEDHLPKMYSFWNSLLFGTRTYKGHPFRAHIPLPVTPAHFDHWISIFEQNIDEHFTGEVAEHTKLRARSIAHIFRSKLLPDTVSWS